MGDLFGLIDERMAVRVFEGSRPNTVRTKATILRAWSRYLGDTDIVDATRQDVRGFVGRPGLSSNTRAQYLTTLRVFYRWIIEEGHAMHDPTGDVKGPRYMAGLPRPIPVEHFRRALDTASPNVRLWILLGAYGGLRCCEMAELRGEDIDLDGETPTMLLHGKGGKRALVPVHPVLIDELRVRASRPGWMFPHKWRPGEHVLAGSVSKLINEHLHGLGIESTAHALRHLFGTSVYRESGYDLRLTQELMRHASPATTAIYTKVDRADAAKVVNRLNLNGSKAMAVAIGAVPVIVETMTLAACTRK